MLPEFEQRGPPESPLELAAWELKRQALREDLARAEANHETPFWSNLRYNWIILPLGSVLILVSLVLLAAFAKVVAWAVRGFT
jgi:hypothetical protein